MTTKATPEIQVQHKPFAAALKARTATVLGSYPPETLVTLVESTEQGQPTGNAASARVIRAGKGQARAAITGHNASHATHKTEILQTVIVKLL